MASMSKLPVSGKITCGIPANALVERTVSFVHSQLPKWRDDASRPYAEAEEALNGQLCKFLNDRARDEFPMAIFQHEEKQGRRRRVDLSVVPSSAAISANIYESIYDPYLVMEGKRLPAPASGREREYLTGLAEQSGGVQRFRLGLHGGTLTVAAIIGYIQQGDISQWRQTINGWIATLAASGEDSSCGWKAGDALDELTLDTAANASRCESRHARSGGAPPIRLVHLWLRMPAKKNEAA